MTEQQESLQAYLDRTTNSFKGLRKGMAEMGESLLKALEGMKEVLPSIKDLDERND